MKSLLFPLFALTAAAVASAAAPLQLHPHYKARQIIVASASQPPDARYLAFPSVLSMGPDELWIAYKAGARHATDPGAGIEVVSHRLSTGATHLIQRLNPVPPKLYQMAELVRLPDQSVRMYLDVHAMGDDRRHYRTGAEVFRWDADAKRFSGPAMLGPVDGVTYGYPFDFISAGPTTWQLIMSFGYLPGGRWSVDAIRSDDAGHSWRFVRNLSAEFGGLRLNESGFVRHGDGFIVSTRGYDDHERLHAVDRDFHVKRQLDLTERYDFLQRYIGRPRVFIRDGYGYLLGRNWTRPADAPAEHGGVAGAMKLCLFRFDLDTLEISAWSILDNAAEDNVTDGYYAVPVFSGTGAETLLHVITYKAKNNQPPDIIRLDYRWDEVK